MASNRWWLPTEEVLRKKAKGKGWTGKFVTAEFRGCGKSSPPKSEAEVDMSLFARDYVALVRGLNLGPTHVVGHSTGGLIAALIIIAMMGGLKALGGGAGGMWTKIRTEVEAS